MRSTKFFAFAAVLPLAAGCSVRSHALRAVADTLASNDTGGAFATDDDPELVGDAVPFALKTMESLADSLQDHVGLRLALARGFTTYAYAFVQQPAELGAPPDRMAAALARARKLYLRARAYGLDGLRLRHGTTEAQLRGPERAEALRRMQKEDVPFLYWTLAPWAAAISANKRDMELLGDLPVVAALLDRALELDEAWDEGSLHEFALTFDAARPEGTTPEKQDAHFNRAMQLARGLRVSPLVTYAEAVLAPRQDKKRYVAVLTEAVNFDVDRPEARHNRLANVLAQRRARYLLSRLDDVFSS